MLCACFVPAGIYRTNIILHDLSLLIQIWLHPCKSTCSLNLESVPGFQFYMPLFEGTAARMYLKRLECNFRDGLTCCILYVNVSYVGHIFEVHYL